MVAKGLVTEPVPIPACKHVRIGSSRPLLRELAGLVVESGKVVDVGGERVKVYHASPSPSVVTPLTEVEVVPWYRYRVEEMKGDVVVEISSPEKRDYLIYPRASFEEVLHVVEPLAEGKRPRAPGMLLYGPPGTGKTSLIEFVSNAFGLYRVDVTPDAVLSKYVGESEQKLAKLFEVAKSRAPSLVAMDDAEWIAVSREGLAGHISEGTTVHLSLMNILLRRIPELSEHGSLAIMSTNVKPSLLDPALLRPGRHGRPIFIPLPSYEAIKKIMELKGVDERTADQLARRLASVGASMADVNEVVEKLKLGRPPRLETIVGQGYIRPFPSYLLSEEDVRKVLWGYDVRALVGHPARLSVVAGERAVFLAFTISLLAGVGVPLVLLRSSRGFDEAVSTAEVVRGFLIVDTEAVEQGALKEIHSTARCPVVYVGNPGGLQSYRWLDRTRIMNRLGASWKEVLLKSVESFYDVRFEERARAYLLKMAKEDAFMKVLEQVAFGFQGLAVTESDVKSLEVA